MNAVMLYGDDDVMLLDGAFDRGSGNRQVLDRLLARHEKCRLVLILGDHEQMLPDLIDGRVPLQCWLKLGGAETLDSYGKDSELFHQPELHVVC